MPNRQMIRKQNDANHDVVWRNSRVTPFALVRPGPLRGKALGLMYPIRWRSLQKSNA